MDGIHDLGGMQGFGQVPHRANSLSYKPVFHEDWEHLAYSLLFLAAGHLGTFSVDELRHAIERMEAPRYFNSPYYDRIVIGTATLLVECGVLTQKELDDVLGEKFALARPSRSKGRSAVLGRPAFEVGDSVVVRNEFVTGHVRMPAYCRGKEGVILHRTTQEWPFPDAIGHGDKSATMQPTYHVQFEAKDLWRESTDTAYVVVDLFESYLDKAPIETQPVSFKTRTAAAV